MRALGERIRYPSPISRRNPGIWQFLRIGCGVISPEELFDENGKLIAELAELAPKGERRMGANPHANGGLLLKDLLMPDFRDYAVEVSKPGTGEAESTRNFRNFPARCNETEFGTAQISASLGLMRLLPTVLTLCIRLRAKRGWSQILADDENLSPDGRVMEVLSEHMCQGWLEGYLLTGRHGFFSCYEAFIHIVDSMFNQHAKWLKVTRHIPWRRPIASLNLLVDFARLAPGPQRLYAIRTPGSLMR